MSPQLQKRLQALAAGPAELLGNIHRGIEKESLRISADGRLAQTPHPAALGSPLTHSCITTDYSEALMEFITPVSTSIDGSLQTLEDIHSYVYRHLGDEILWSASMPCIMTGDEGIPVAQYGSSNVARMKTVYRYGLGHRYGRLMQAIAGIHYNFSMPEPYWQQAWREAGSPGDISAYISDRYLGLIRNFRRYSWLLIYLFGASPAVCASFLRGRQNHELQPFDAQGHSLYLPYGTALRMGDLGYSSNAQKDLQVCYNSLDSYIQTLHKAIVTSHPGYQHIPAGQGGEYQQLNDCLLQIENEFYSPIRPKRVAQPGETPLNALARAGIEYIEVRCVDVSPFSPTGLDAQQIRFLDIFLLYCLLQDSPECNEPEQTVLTSNMEAVVNRGRQPGLLLQTCSGSRPLAEWGQELLSAMQPLAGLLDEIHQGSIYQSSLDEQVARVHDPELTPSARILREMREQDLPFFRLALGYSQRWAEYFKGRELAPEVMARFEAESRRSLQAQHDLEADQTIDFEQYLQNFFRQYQAL